MPDHPTTAALLGPPPLPTPGVQNLRPSHVIRFAVDQVAPPTPLYTQINDFISVATLCQGSGLSYTLDMRYLMPNGEIVVQRETQVIQAGGFIFNSFACPEGFLLNVSLIALGGFIQRGRLYVILKVQRGPTSAPIVQFKLASGYVQTDRPICWPNFVEESATSGQGFIQSRAVANPAAGADWSYIVPGGGIRTRIQSVIATLTTGVGVANRIIALQMDDGVGLIGEAVATTVQTASLAIVYIFQPGITTGATANGFAQTGITTPAYVPQAGHIKTVTTAIQAADQWSAITIGTEEWWDL